MAGTNTDAASEYRLGDYLLGIEGLAILRETQTRQFERLEKRRWGGPGNPGRHTGSPLCNNPRGLPEANLDEGYTTWSETYDHPTGSTRTRSRRWRAR